MGTVMIINPTPYNLQPVPEVGKEYHIFDDGKIRFGRHHIATVVEIIPTINISASLTNAWQNEIERCPWLYAPDTDYFIKAEAPSYDDEYLYFVRTTDGGWFSIDYPTVWMSARLDIDGTLYAKMIQDYGDFKI